MQIDPRRRVVGRWLVGALLVLLAACALWWVRSTRQPDELPTQDRDRSNGGDNIALADESSGSRLVQSSPYRAIPGDDFLLRRMNDEQLELEHARIAELIELDLRHSWDHSTCLLEMARRGGERWTSFLRVERELARIPESAGPPHVGAESELTVLTALRRAEGRPDPGRMVLRSTSPRSSRVGEGLKLEYALRNEDPDDSFEVSTWDFERVRAEVRDASGALVPRKQSPDVLGGGPAESWRLQPGASTKDSPGQGWWTFELSEQFELAPGEYSLELGYAADRWAETAFLEDTRGLVVLRSSAVSLVVIASK